MINILIAIVVACISLLVIVYCADKYTTWDWNRNKMRYEKEAHNHIKHMYKEIEPFVLDTIRKYNDVKKE
jgi:flagellar basal body-associated protein FliL